MPGSEFEFSSSGDEHSISETENIALSTISDPMEQDTINKIVTLLRGHAIQARRKMCAVVGTKYFADQCDKDIDWAGLAAFLHAYSFDAIDGGRPTVLRVARNEFLTKTEDGVEYWEVGQFKVQVDVRNDKHVTRWYYYLEWIIINLFPTFLKFRREYGNAFFAACIDRLFTVSPTNKIVLRQGCEHMSEDPTVKAFLEASTHAELPDKFNGVDILGFILDNVIAKGVEHLVTPFTKLDILYRLALDSTEEITPDELDQWFEVLRAHRDLRRKHKHSDAVSKLVSNVFPSKRCDVASKFVVPLCDLIKEVGTEWPHIIVGGSGLKNNFGALIRYVFPKSMLHFVDIDKNCERAALSVERADFTCCSVLDYVKKNPGWPVISDAVAPYVEGSGKDRGTWIRMDENMHQLALLNMATKGQVPWSICKLPAPFGKHKQYGSYLKIFEDMRLQLHGSVRYHNGETIAYKIFKSERPSNISDYRKYLKKCFLVEEARQHAFLWGLFPSTLILNEQLENFERYKNAFDIVDAAFLEFKIVPVKPPKKEVKVSEAVFSPKTEDLDYDFANETKVKKEDFSKVKKEKSEKQEVWKKKDENNNSVRKEPLRVGAVEVKTNLLPKSASVSVPRERATTARASTANHFDPKWDMAAILSKFPWYATMSDNEKAAWRVEHKGDHEPYIDSLFDYLYDLGDKDAPNNDQLITHLISVTGQRWIALYLMSKTYSRFDHTGGRWYIRSADKQRMEEKRVQGYVSKSAAGPEWFTDY